MNQAIYQSYLDAKQAHDQAYASILSELVSIAKQAEADLDRVVKTLHLP